MSDTVIQIEISRHASMYKAIADYQADRSAQLNLHDSRLKSLETERLEERNWNEKNDLTEKMMEHQKKDPRKYLIPFENMDSPYFGIVGIHDEDAKIGVKEYVLGKQSLINGSKVHIVDWRKAEVSRFFYEYDENDTYEEEFKNKYGTIDRIGKITHKKTITIFQKILRSIETSSDTFKLVDGTWITKDGTLTTPVSAELKTDTGNHQLIDIVALISPVQFASITNEKSGCVVIRGGAGAGKTTVALHRLSYLQFNYPNTYRAERCMVIVFNKELKNYVKNTSTELLGTTVVDTFAAWAKKALLQYGVSQKDYTLSIKLNEYNEIKKHSDTAEMLQAYVINTPVRTNPIIDLVEFYTSQQMVSKFMPDENPTREGYFQQAAHILEHREISFADLAILLRLCQLRYKNNEVELAFNYFDHIVADEAQDFSKIELETIYAALGSKKCLTLCADKNQKILAFVDATGLSQFEDNLQTIGLDKTTLTIGYRSAPEIMEIANAVAGKQNGFAPTSNQNVNVVNSADKNAAVNELVRIVREYQKQDPSSLTAIICKGRSDLPFIHNALSEPSNGIVNIHPVGTINFSPGVITTIGYQVKGLEFTNVIVWNPSSSVYRNNDEDRNLLYVIISRACKKLSLIYWQKLSNWFN